VLSVVKLKIMQKIDLKKQLKELYSASARKIAIVDVPAMNFIAIDGQGNPNTSKEFTDAIEALYPIAYTIKFDIKKNNGIDYGVMPLEGLWWCDKMELFSEKNKDDWKWTLQIMQPEFITEVHFKNAINQVAAKKNLPTLYKVRFEMYHDGLAAQLLHIGPYAEETENIKKLHDFIHANGYQRAGKHREIYLSDARKTAPDKLKTIIRQPMKKK
jgi:hypothetical protein